MLALIAESRLISYFIGGNHPLLSRAHIWNLVGALVFLFLGFIVPYWMAIYRFRKSLAGTVRVDQPQKMVLTTNGFSLQWTGEGMEDKPAEYYQPESIKVVEDTNRFVIILLFHGPAIVIPKQYFHVASDVSLFMGLLSGMMNGRGGRLESYQAKMKRLALWGLVGIIPNFGVISGLVLLVQGIFRYRNRNLIIIGLADILWTIVFWTIVSHFEMNSRFFVDSQKQFSKGQLNIVFKSIEFYKLQHGYYPDSLKEVEDIKGNVWITDPLHRIGAKAGNFYYQKTGDRYWLFSVGEDGKPFTADDIYPGMNPADSMKFGLRLR